MPLRLRHRCRVALVVILCLLFQQVALAAYACPLQQMPPAIETMAEHCADMGMAQAEDNPALCAKHCAPDIATAADSAKLSVPALLLPAQAFAPVQPEEAGQCTPGLDIPVTTSDPPPRLRFCSLLI